MMEPPPPEGQSSPKKRCEVELIPSFFTPDIDDSWDKLMKGMLKNRFLMVLFLF